MFLERDFITKKEIAQQLGWDYIKKDRQIRMLVSELAQKYPIISTSDNNKGFKLAKDPSDIDFVKQSWAENSSRQDELTKRNRPLIKFLEKYNSGITLFD